MYIGKTGNTNIRTFVQIQLSREERKVTSNSLQFIFQNPLSYICFIKYKKILATNKNLKVNNETFQLFF